MTDSQLKRLILVAAMAALAATGWLVGDARVDAAESAIRPKADAAPALVHVKAVAFLETHCVDCHGPEKPKGKFQLHDLIDKDFDPADNKRWQNIVEMVDLGDMPPAKRPQPADTERAVLRQIALAIAAQTDGTTELRLSPEELGRVRLSLTTADGLVTLAIQAERPETADLIRRNLDLLAQDFRDMGFGGFEFSFGDRPHARDQQGGDSAFDPDPSDPAQVPAETLILRGLDLRL